MLGNNKLYFDKWDKKTKDLQYIRKKTYILVNSKDRVFATNPQPQQYSVILPVVYKNVESVRLVSGTIPDLNNAREEPFLILDIPELNNKYTRYETTSGNFDLFDLIRFSNNYTNTNFIYIQASLNNLFKTTLGKLSKITINIRDQYGDLFSFGVDDSNIQKVLQNSFVFEITTLEANTYKLGETTVY